MRTPRGNVQHRIIRKIYKSNYSNIIRYYSTGIIVKNMVLLLKPARTSHVEEALVTDGQFVKNRALHTLLGTSSPSIFKEVCVMGTAALQLPSDSESLLY